MDSFNIQNYFKRGKTVVLTLRHGDDEGARQWSDKESNDLINQMKNFLPEFQNQRRRKKEVWEDVSNELQKHGNSWTSEDCRKKWSNMIRTFRGIEEQKHDPVSKFKRVKWPFFDLMYQILSLHGSDNLPECQTVVQLIKHGTTTNTSHPSSTSSSGSGIYSRKVNPLKPTTFSAPNVNAPLHSSLIESSQQSILQLSQPDNDVMSLDHHGPTSDLHSSDGLDSNLLFSDEPIRFPRSDPPQPVTSSASTLAYHTKPKVLLAARPKKRLLKKKLGKVSKCSGSEPVDSVLAKFMEDTNKQNEMILEKLTSFHESTLSVMQERNDLLREIRDSLHDSQQHSVGDLSHESLEQSAGHHHQESETLTLHMGPPYSTNVATSSQAGGGNVVSQLNSTLVLSDAEAASALSTFQLVDDGTVLTGLDGHVSLLHPTLVSVVQDASSNSNSINLMTSSTSAPKRKLIKRDLN